MEDIAAALAAIRADLADYRRCSAVHREKIDHRLDAIEAKFAAATLAAKILNWTISILAGVAAVWVLVESWFRKHPPVGG